MTDVRLSFHYEGPINTNLDELLRSIGERAGFEWYASGTDLRTGMRDLAFHADILMLETTEKAPATSGSGKTISP